MQNILTMLSFEKRQGDDRLPDYKLLNKCKIDIILQLVQAVKNICTQLK